MPSAPILLSRAQLPGSEQVPQLPSGENLFRAEVAGAEGLAQAETQSAVMIGQMRRQSQAAEAQFLQTLASGVNGVAQAIATAQNNTKLLEKNTAGKVEINQVRTEYDQNPDWKTAGPQAREKVAEIKKRLRADLSPEDQAKFDHSLAADEISLDRHINTNTAQKTNDAAKGAYDAGLPASITLAARAGSPEEQNAHFAQNEQKVDGMVSGGQISAQEGVAKKLAFRQNVYVAQITQRIADRPEEALAAIRNRDMFPGLDENMRVALEKQALRASDALSGMRAAEQYQRDPVAAIATYARVPDPAMISQVVRRGLIPGESGGNAAAQSHAGAAGIAQIVPDTARGLAKRLGWSDLDGLDDAGVRAWLKANPEKSVLMAEREIGDIWRRTGSLAAAFAGYHAGPGNAADWHKAAVAQFGEGYSAAQFISVIPADVTDAKPGKPGMKTRDYVASMLARVGADPGRGGVSTMQAYRNADIVRTSGDQEQAERLRTQRAIVSANGDSTDAVINSLSKGWVTDPARIRAVEEPLITASAAGVPEATQKLRMLTEAKAFAADAQHFYGMQPQQIEAEVAGMRQAVAQGANSPFQQRRLAAAEAVLQEISTARNTNPVGLIERSGAVPVTQVAAPQDPGSAQFGAQLASRAATATAAADRYGGELKMLKPAEAAALKARFGDMQPDDKARLLTTASAAIRSGRAYDAFVNEVAGSDSIARTAGRLGRADPAIAAEILRGQTLLDQPGVKPKVAEVRAELQAKLPSNVYPAEVQGDLIEASLALYAAEKGKAGALFDRTDRAGLERAIARVAGDMVDVNGRKAPVPYGTPARDLSEGWRRLDASTVQQMGGAYGAGGEALDPAFLGRNAILKPLAAGGGRYAVFVPQGGQDRPVLTLDGAPAVVTLDMLRRGSERRSAAEAAALMRPRERVDVWPGAGAVRGPSE